MQNTKAEANALHAKARGGVATAKKPSPFSAPKPPSARAQPGLGAFQHKASGAQMNVGAGTQAEAAEAVDAGQVNAKANADAQQRLPPPLPRQGSAP